MNPFLAPSSPFWVSLVEHTRVEIWKESLLIVQLPRLCMLLPVAEWPFSSNSALVDGRLKYVPASSSFFASACGFEDATGQMQLTISCNIFYPLGSLILLTIMIFALYHLLNRYFFFNFLFYIGVSLINNVVLVSGGQQSDSIIHIHVSILFQILFPTRSLHNIEQSSLC